MIRDSLAGKVAVEQDPEGKGEQTMQLSAGRAFLRGNSECKGLPWELKGRGDGVG